MKSLHPGEPAFAKSKPSLPPIKRRGSSADGDSGSLGVGTGSGAGAAGAAGGSGAGGGPQSPTSPDGDQAPAGGLLGNMITWLHCYISQALPASWLLVGWATSCQGCLAVGESYTHCV